MLELLQASFAWINLPFTVLFMLSMSYWLLVIVGGIGADAIDFDLDTDVEVDVDVDVSAGAEVDADAAAPEGQTSGGFFNNTLAFFDLGELPFMLVFTIFSMASWAIAVIAHSYLPAGPTLLRVGIHLPTVVAAAFATKSITFFLVRAFRSYHNDTPMVKSVRGHMCTLLSDADGERMAQAEIKTDGAPFRVMVRTRGELLKEGSNALIITKADNENVYIIEQLPV